MRPVTAVFYTALAVLTLAAPSSARAQAFISPLVGYDFGGDSGCPEIAGCEDKKLNVGAAVGTMGGFFGAELDISYARDFFGATPDYGSSVLTIMGNVLVGPRLGAIQPYGTAGLGLIKSRVDLTLGSLTDPSNDDFGWNLGGGLMILLSDRIGIRGDIRHFHAFQDLSLAGLPLGNTKLDFGRASGALMFRF